MTARSLIAAAAIVTCAALTACAAPVDLAGHTFACTTHRDCGTGARCDDGVCHVFGTATADASGGLDADVTTPEGPPCSTLLTASEPSNRAQFVLETDPATGARQLRVTFGDLEERFALPEDVIGLEAGGCCEDACCTLLGAP